MASPYSDPPPALIDLLRRAVSHLPEIEEQKAWAGTRWLVRRRNFCHALDVTNDQTQGRTITVITFRSEPPELDILRQSGHPFFQAGWGTNVVGMVLDDDTQWDEVRELLTDSFCILAPKKLAALVDRPG